MHAEPSPQRTGGEVQEFNEEKMPKRNEDSARGSVNAGLQEESRWGVIRGYFCNTSTGLNPPLLPFCF